MKILAVSDEENNILWSERIKDIANNVDLIISCGDLRKDYLDFLVSMLNVPLLYVFGNHDDYEPEGGICIDGKIYVHEGIKIFGLGGCMRYRPGKNMYTENEMILRYFRAWPKLMINGIDLFITHAPAKNYGDLDNVAHKGFNVFNRIMNKYKPEYMLHGHVHKSYGRIKNEYIHESGTKIINVCDYRIIDIYTCKGER